MSLKKRMILVILTFAVFGMAGVAQADFDAYSARVLADSPILYLHLDETTGTLAADASGNGNNGTYTGGVVLDGAGAMVGSAAPTFNGSNGFVNLPGTWGGGSEVTIECWSYLNGASGTWQAMVSALDGTFVHFQTFNSGVNVATTDAGGVSLAIIPQSPLGVWKYVVIVFESGNSRLYVDGAVFSTNPMAYTTITPTNIIRVASGYNSGRFFNGRLDEVAIYNTALSESRILAHLDAAIAPAITGIPTVSDWGAGLFVLILATAGMIAARFALR